MCLEDTLFPRSFLRTLSLREHGYDGGARQNLNGLNLFLRASFKQLILSAFPLFSSLDLVRLEDTLFPRSFLRTLSLREHGYDGGARQNLNGLNLFLRASFKQRFCAIRPIC